MDVCVVGGDGCLCGGWGWMFVWWVGMDVCVVGGDGCLCGRVRMGVCVVGGDGCLWGGKNGFW